MIVFSTYFKIFKKYIHLILIYTSIFLVLTILLTFTNNPSSSFEAVKPKITIINEDNSLLVDALIKYLEDDTQVIELDSNISKEDAIFFREVNYILIIPESFTSDFLQGNEVSLDSMSVADATDVIYTEMLINKFLNIAKIYINTGINEEVIANNILNDLSKEASVEMLNINENKGTLEKIVYYFNFTNYVFLAFLIAILGIILDSFKKEEIHKRNAISGYSVKKINGQLLLANLAVVLLVWFAYMLISIILYGRTMLTINGLLLMLNSLIFILFALSVAFLVGRLVKGDEAINALANIISLGTSFLCGSFVPQEFLGKTILNVAHIFPSYYFIKNNNDIVKMTSFTNFSPIFINMLIVLISALIIYLITNIITKKRLRK